MTTSVKFLDLRLQRPSAPIIPVGTIVRYVGASSPKWYGLEATVYGAYTFDGEMVCYRVELPDGSKETWMDVEIEVA